MGGTGKRRSVVTSGPGTAAWRTMDLGEDVPPIQKPVGRGGTRKKETQGLTEEEKRLDMLERNRQAALRCRQRKKKWLSTLQEQADVLSSENDMLRQTVIALREEVAHLKGTLADIRTQQAASARAGGKPPHAHAALPPHVMHGGGGWT